MTNGSHMAGLLETSQGLSDWSGAYFWILDYSIEASSRPWCHNRQWTDHDSACKQTPWYLLLPHQTASCHPEITNSWCSSCPCALTNSFSVGLLQQCARRPPQLHDQPSTVGSTVGSTSCSSITKEKSCLGADAGWYIHTDYTTKSVSYRTSVCMDWLHHTCQHD